MCERELPTEEEEDCNANVKTERKESEEKIRRLKTKPKEMAMDIQSVPRCVFTFLSVSSSWDSLHH